MRIHLAGTIGLAALAALAACNEGRSGANSKVQFTPLNCGNLLLGCSFDKSLGLWADTDVQIQGIDGYPTAGLDLRSGDTSVLTVSRVEDQANVPTWKINGAGEGVAELGAYDGSDEVDFIEVGVRAAERLELQHVLGNAVGPTVEDGVETYTVNAEQPVSLQARMIVDESALLIGRTSYTVTVPAGSRLLDSELDGSDREQGYLYVSPPAGVYPFSFELAVAPQVKIDAVLKAE
ncbi:MAG TPA: hypothetical protein VHE35_20505 [Kofleriaceae bacterium]|nr:hypothetical protein [Kofleriaceae bacterium]